VTSKDARSKPKQRGPRSCLSKPYIAHRFLPGISKAVRNHSVNPTALAAVQVLAWLTYTTSGR
jgi:BarA-like signal transduction histidine kinase